MANAFARQQPATQQPIETGTSGCAGRRHWSEATGGGLQPRDGGLEGESQQRIPQDGGLCGGEFQQSPKMAVYVGGVHSRRLSKAAHTSI